MSRSPSLYVGMSTLTRRSTRCAAGALVAVPDLSPAMIAWSPNGAPLNLHGHRGIHFAISPSGTPRRLPGTPMSGRVGAAITIRLAADVAAPSRSNISLGFAAVSSASHNTIVSNVGVASSPSGSTAVTSRPCDVARNRASRSTPLPTNAVLPARCSTSATHACQVSGFNSPCGVTMICPNSAHCSSRGPSSTTCRRGRAHGSWNVADPAAS